jgi:hypothetical protein
MATLANILTGTTTPPGSAPLAFLGNVPGSQTVDPTEGIVNSGLVTMPGGFSSATDPTLLANLATLQKYDPNAKIIANQTDQGGGESGQNLLTTYNLQYNQDALPQTGLAKGTAAMVPDGGYGSENQYQLGNTDEAILHGLKDPSQVQQSIYGGITPTSNVTTQYAPGKKTALDIYGPMLPLLAAGGLPALFNGAGLAAGGAASAGSAFAVPGGFTGGIADAAAGAGGASTTGALGNTLSRLTGNTIDSGGKVNPLSLLPVAGAAAGVPSWLLPLINAANSARQGGGFNVNPVGAAMTLGGIFRNAGT